MSFLGDLFKAGTGGTEDAGRAFMRAGDDFAKGDFEGWQNEGENTWDGLASIPGTSFSMADGFYQGANGDLDWNPYSADNSVWDRMMGGAASESESNRRTGRTIGSLIGGYFAAGGLGQLLGSKVGGAAAAGALQGGAQAAGTGGNREEIAKGVYKGGLYGGGGAYVAGLDAAGEMGVTNPALAGAINSGLGSAVVTAATPGTDSRSIGKSAAYGGLQGGFSGMNYDSGNDANPYRVEYNPDTKSFGSSNQSMAPWANGTSLTAQPQMSVAPYASGYEFGGMTPSVQAEPKQSLMDQLNSVLGDYLPNGLSGLAGGNLGNYSQGLMGLYQANRQRRQAKEMMGLISGRRNAYGDQMRRNLMARDAAAGKRGDYSGRETQLQASLAELDSRNAPTMMALMNAENDSRASALQTLLRTGSKTGWFNQPINPMSFQYNSIPEGPSLAQLQNQLDPTDWERTRRLDAFGA